MTTPFGLTPIDFRYFATPAFVDRSTFGIALVPAPAEVIKIVPATITPTKPSSLFGCTSSPSPRAAGGAPLADRPTVSHLLQKSRGNAVYGRCLQAGSAAHSSRRLVATSS